MANIDTYLEQIKNAIYGEEVRDAIYESIKAVNEASKDLTFEEYAALPDASKVNGTVYYLTDIKRIMKNGIDYTSGEDNAETGSKNGTTLLFEAANAPAKVFDIEIRPYQDDHGWGSVWAGGTGKNKFHVTASTSELNGLTFTVASNGRVTVSGTATLNTTFSLGTFSNIGSFVLNGCGAGANPLEPTPNYYLELYGSTPSQDWKCVGPDVNVNNSSGAELTLQIWVRAGVTMENITFEPMIRSTGSNSFVPYANVCSITKRTSIPIHSHGVNLFDYQHQTKVSGYIIDPTNLNNLRAVSDGGHTKFTKVQPKVAYTIDGKIVDFEHTMYIYQFDKNQNPIKCSGAISEAMLPFTFTTASNTRYIGYSYQESYYSEATVQIQIGGAATKYEAFNDHYSYSHIIGIETWGGTYHGLEGKLYEHWAEIASYAGETLPGEWLSDRDSYSDSKNPTIGAQVVYRVATENVQDVNVFPFNTIFGTNSIWTERDDELYIEYVNKAWEDVARTEELTLEQYNAMHEVDQMDGTIRFITDKGYIILNGIVYGAGGGGASSGTLRVLSDVDMAAVVRSTSTITVTEGE